MNFLFELPTVHNNEAQSYHYIKSKQERSFYHRITPELEGFKRPDWAQIEAELCVSDLGWLFFLDLFDYRVAQKRRSSE